MAARAIRPISKLLGKSYEAGQEIPADVIGQISPQALRSLINNHHIEVDGQEPDAGSTSQHLRAKCERLDEKCKQQDRQIAVLQQSHDDLAKRVAAMEGKSPKKLSKRESRAAAPPTKE